MRALARWLRVHHARDPEKRVRTLQHRFRAVSRTYERATRRRKPYRWGKLLAVAFIGTGLVAGVSPWLPLLPTTAEAEQITSHARIIDGDTIEVRGTRIRLHGIDAPELHQKCRREAAPAGSTYSCGQDAKSVLERIIGGGTVACVAQDRDRHGRIIATCVAETSDIAREMVRQGWAIAYTRYSVAYVIDEVVARAANRALWAGEFDAPEEWRRRQKRD